MKTHFHFKDRLWVIRFLSFLLLSNISSLLSLPFGEGWGGAVQAQGVYKNQYIYAHTFEDGLNTGIFKDPNQNCVKFVSFEGTKRTFTTRIGRSLMSGDKDSPIYTPLPDLLTTTTVSAETTGATVKDDGFGAGLFARCFTFFLNETADGTIKLTNQFLVGSNPNVKGVYFEMGHVNMDGTYVTNSKSQYRLVVKNSSGTELFNSGVLNNAAVWNKFFVPFPASLNTAAWAGQNITFELRAWTNSATGSQVFRVDDIALIGTTSCSTANLALGNLVWEDSNADGTADAAEPKLANVCMNLYADDGDGIFEPQTTASYDASKDAFMGQTSTDAAGKYSFTGLGAGDYFVSVCRENFKGSGALAAGYVPTYGTAVSSNTDQDNKDHGINFKASFKYYAVTSDKITLTVGGEPTNDGDDANTNSSIDFGFLKLANPLSLGNLVWDDANEDGLKDTGEVGINDVWLKLYKDTDNSGTFSTADEIIDETTTAGGGLYRFDGLVPANYVVVVVTENFGVGKVLNSYRPSKGLDPAADPDTDTDNDDNGILDGYRVVGKAITLAIGTEPTTDGDGADANMTYDFGFTFPCNDPGSKKADVALGGDLWDEMAKMIKTTDGGVLAAGTSESDISGSKSQNNRGFGEVPNPDYWVVKTDGRGNKIWDKTFGSTDAEYLISVANTTDGGYLLAGNRIGTPTTGGVWIVKIDGTGTEVWNKYVNLNGTDHWTIDYMTATADGGFLLGNNTTANRGIVKIDASGNKVWSQAVNGLVTANADGTFIVLDNTTMNVQQLSSTGTNVWSQPYANVLTKPTVAMAITGGYLTGGINGTDSQLRKLTATGTETWYKTFTGFMLNDAKQNADGTFVLTGSTATDQKLIKLDAAGTILWEKTYGGTGSETAVSVVCVAGGYLVGGNSTSGGGTTLKNSQTIGFQDFWLVSVCDGAGDVGGVLSLGNLIWKDDNNDGIKDAAETPIANVKVQLYVDADGNGFYSSANDVFVRETTTDGNGLYLFTGLPKGDYFVRVAPENFNGGQPLNKYSNSTGATLSNSDTNDRDHGNDTQQAAQFGVISSLITLLEGAEPVNDGDTDANSNLTIDFGFYLPPSNLCVGNLIWKDLNNNAVFDTGEPKIQGVTVQLFADTDGDAMFTPGTDLQVGTNQVTDANGLYKFCGLDAGDYFVVIPKTNWGTGNPLDKLVNSITFAGGNFDVDNDDSGVEEMAGPDGYDEVNYGVVSTRVTLAQGYEPDVAVDGDDKNGNMTIDFGFFQPVNLGDLVWNDTNLDGIKDAAETPIANVAVDLFIDNGDGIFDPLVDNFYFQQLTDASGNYFFDRLAAGKFFVRVSAINFDPIAGVLKDTKPSAGTSSGNSDLNNRDHGIDLVNPVTDGVLSSIVDLAVGTEPALAVDGDGTDGNLTIDFGFGPKCAATITASPTACTLGRYSVSGSITISNPPTTGTLFISDGGESITLNAPFTSPIAYTLSGLRANGASRNVVFSFSACVDCQGSITYTAPAQCPSTACSIAVTATPTACDGATGNYGVSGSVTFANAPTTGTLTVSDGVKTQTFNAPFTSPSAYSLTGIGSNGAIHNVVAAFSADTACVNGVSYLAPMACKPTDCVINLLADAGACKVTKLFDITGSVTFANAPTTGTLTLTGGGKTQVFNAPFTSPQAFTLTDANAASQPVTVTASFSAGCNANLSLIAPCVGVPVFDLALKKELVPASPKNPTVIVGSNVTFKVSIINQGSITATNVQVTDYIPTGLTLNDANWTAVGGKATLNTPIATLAGGATVTRDITFTVGTTLGAIRNFAEISAATGGTDVDSTPDADNTNDGTPKDDVLNEDHKTTPANDEDDHDYEDITVTAAPVFDLALKKTLATDQTTTVVQGTNAKFTISIINQGNVDATNVQVTDYIPTGLTLNDANWTAVGGKATLLTPIATLAAGATVTRDINLSSINN
jgi:uncharacterized repeat protein (TIGR01451 family)